MFLNEFLISQKQQIDYMIIRTEKTRNRNEPVTLWLRLLPKKHTSVGPCTQGRGTGWGGCGQADLICSSQLERSRAAVSGHETHRRHSDSDYSPLYDSVRGQRLLPLELNGARGQGNRKWRGLMCWRRCQSAELTGRSEAAALTGVDHRKLKSWTLVKCPQQYV